MFLISAIQHGNNTVNIRIGHRLIGILVQENPLHHAAGGCGNARTRRGMVRGIHMVCRRFQCLGGVYRHPAHHSGRLHNALLLLDHMRHLVGQVLFLSRPHKDLVALRVGQCADCCGAVGIIMDFHVIQADAGAGLQCPCHGTLELFQTFAIVPLALRTCFILLFPLPSGWLDGLHRRGGGGGGSV